MAKRNVKALQKVFDFPLNGKNYKVNLKVEHYQDNGNIALKHITMAKTLLPSLLISLGHCQRKMVKTTSFLTSTISN